MKKRKKLRKKPFYILITLVIVIVAITIICQKNILEKNKNNHGSNNQTYSNINKSDDNSNQPNNSSDDSTKDNSSNDFKDDTQSNTNNNSKDNNQNNSSDIKTSSNYPKLKIDTSSKEVIGTTSKGFEISKINGATYIDEYLIANKTYALPSNFVPENTLESPIGKTNTCNKCININAYNAFKDMQSDAAALGLNIYIASGYRPYVSQEKIYNNYVIRDGKTLADTYSSRAGHSEHQTGLCFDLNSISDAFATTDEGKWVNEHAHLYGFIIRFPKGKEAETGYKYESWHLRYVGTDLSSKLFNNGDWLSLEGYFGITSSYDTQ